MNDLSIPSIAARLCADFVDFVMIVAAGFIASVSSLTLAAAASDVAEAVSGELRRDVVGCNGARPAQHSTRGPQVGAGLVRRPGLNREARFE